MKFGNHWFNCKVRAEHGKKFQFLQYALTKLRNYLSVFTFSNLFHVHILKLNFK